jgi:uncharacterized membrane protein YqgA involved in biofilm formation
MIKHIFNLRNVLIVTALVVVVGIIIGQQALLEEKISEYDQAVLERENVNAEREALDIE